MLRDFGDVRAAIGEFQVAGRLARQAAGAERQADALTSLGTALVMAGRTDAGLAALDDAVAKVSHPTPLTTGSAATGSAATGSAATGSASAELGRILVRRGGSLWMAGRYESARADLRRAITLTSQAGETVWEARARTAAALADLAVGAVTGRKLA